MHSLRLFILSDFHDNNECLQQQSLGSYQPSMRHELSRSKRQSWREESGQAVFSVDLQMSLLNAWSKHGVADYYQNIFLAHLDEQLPRVVQEKIKREVKQTIMKSSYFFRLESLQNQRHYLQQEIKDQLRDLPIDASDEELVSPIRKVRILREVNLDEAETIIKMYQEYHCKDSEMRSRQLKEFAMLIDQLQQSTAFIKASQLSSHIHFREGFDPFFMNNYQSYHKQPSCNAVEALRELYSLNISSVYRLMKAKSLLSDIRTASQEQTHKKRRERERERFRFQSLPTLHTAHQLSASNKNRIAVPIDISSRERTSRTTIHPLYKGRPQSSYTEQYQKPKLKLSKAGEERQSIYSHGKAKKNLVYLQNDKESKQSAKKYNFNHNQSQLQARNRQQTLPNDLLDYKRMHLRENENKFSLRPYHVGTIETILQPNKVVQFKSYNPIKGQSFEVNITPRSNSKYDYNPQSGHTYINPIEYDKDKRVGLQYQSPIHKRGLKSKRWQGEVSKNPTEAKAKVDRDVQTMDIKANLERQPVPVKKATQAQSEQQQQQRQTPGAMRANQPAMEKDDEVIEDEDIIDERPINQKKLPLIREVSKQQAMRQSPPKQQQGQSPPKQHQKQVEEKRQIKMKIGKLTIKEVLALLQVIKIDPLYKKFFDFDKLIPWIKTSQTYLTQFHINDVCAVVALCSPLPSIGTAIKLWAPIAGQTTPNISINLFTRYIEHIQKSTTAAKIVYQGNGQAFQELQRAGFLKKKEGFYQRARQLPASKSGSQFKPFLYVECSTVNFAQSGKENVIFSSQIQEFNNKNSLVAKFIGSINAATVPQPLKELVKISKGVSSFKEVNNILVNEQFDQYEASLVKASNIQLLRIYISTPLKSTFLAAQGLMKFVGNLLYESGQQCLISLPTLKHNGILLFSKNMSFDAIQQKSKATASTRVYFSVTMFSKKLYGRLSGFQPGSYGNFEVNLTFQDEMQGKIKHNLKIEKCFGPQRFMVSLEVEKILLFCLTVGQEDFIY